MALEESILTKIIELKAKLDYDLVNLTTQLKDLKAGVDENKVMIKSILDDINDIQNQNLNNYQETEEQKKATIEEWMAKYGKPQEQPQQAQPTPTVAPTQEVKSNII